MNRNLDPLWLQSFTAIAQAGSVTRAAQRVHRTPSAVSLHLRQLEASLGAHLVARTTRSLKLTSEGARFLPYAQRLLELQAAARAALHENVEQPVWRIGVSEYFLAQRLDELLSLLQQDAQGARLELLWASSASLQSLWAAGQVDLAVVAASEPPPEAQLVRRERLAWVTAPGHAPSGETATPLVLLGPDCPVRAIAMAALARSGHRYQLRLSCTGCLAALAAIRAGWGVGCLNVSTIPQDLVVLSRQDARRWVSPGRLAFYLLARPALRSVARSLLAWASD
jgi:DNA-binding transcriptional LysR family regulator